MKRYPTKLSNLSRRRDPQAPRLRETTRELPSREAAHLLRRCPQNSYSFFAP